MTRWLASAPPAVRWAVTCAATQSALWLVVSGVTIYFSLGCEELGCLGLDFVVLFVIPGALLLGFLTLRVAGLRSAARGWLLALEVCYLVPAVYLFIDGAILAASGSLRNPVTAIPPEVFVLVSSVLAITVIVNLHRARPVFKAAAASRPNQQLKKLGLVLDSVAEGHRVREISPGSLADTAGIHPGDLITQVNGQVVTRVSQLVFLMLNTRGADGRIHISVRDRADETRDLALERPWSRPARLPARRHTDSAERHAADAARTDNRGD
jgi:hypothetical protein